MTLDLSNPVRAAAIQLQGRVADIPFNLRQVEKLATEAFESGARVVALPEFFTTPITFDERLNACALPPENDALDLLRRLARRHAGMIGGSLLLRRGRDVYNTYVLAQPDGECFTHDKDLPTMWENAFYVGGEDDGVMATGMGPVGAAVCWELIRTQTVLRLKDRVRFVMAGSNWWGGPGNWGIVGRMFTGVERVNVKLATETPVTFARLLGVPVLHASQAGPFDCRFLLAPGLGWSVPYASVFRGATQIVDGEGKVLARRRTEEGPGVVAAEVLLQPGKATLEPDPSRFWIPELPVLMRWYWDHQNACGKWYYRTRGAGASRC